jgi:hypothetical protein
MQNQFPQHMFIHVEVDTQIVGKARNLLVQASQGEKPDLIWFVDNDTLIPPHAGVLIDQAMDLGVVTGVYFNRRPPYHPQVYKIAEEPEYSGMYWPLIDYPSSGLRKEDAIGAGCVCIRMDIFEKLDVAWNPLREGAAAVLESAGYVQFARIVGRLSPWFEFLDRKGEDLYFSERLRDIGQDIWVNYDIKCIHLTTVGITEEHFQAIRDALVPADTPPVGG